MKTARAIAILVQYENVYSYEYGYVGDAGARDEALLPGVRELRERAPQSLLRGGEGQLAHARPRAHVGGARHQSRHHAPERRRSAHAARAAHRLDRAAARAPQGRCAMYNVMFIPKLSLCKRGICVRSVQVHLTSETYFCTIRSEQFHIAFYIHIQILIRVHLLLLVTKGSHHSAKRSSLNTTAGLNTSTTSNQILDNITLPEGFIFYEYSKICHAYSYIHSLF